MAFLDLRPAPNIRWEPASVNGLSKTPIHIGDTFTLDVRGENVVDLAGWQFDIAFDPATP